MKNRSISIVTFRAARQRARWTIIILPTAEASDSGATTHKYCRAPYLATAAVADNICYDSPHSYSIPQVSRKERIYFRASPISHVIDIKLDSLLFFLLIIRIEPGKTQKDRSDVPFISRAQGTSSFVYTVLLRLYIIIVSFFFISYCVRFLLYHFLLLHNKA